MTGKGTQFRRGFGLENKLLSDQITGRVDPHKRGERHVLF